MPKSHPQKHTANFFFATLIGAVPGAGGHYPRLRSLLLDPPHFQPRLGVGGDFPIRVASNIRAKSAAGNSLGRISSSFSDHERASFPLHLRFCSPAASPNNLNDPRADEPFLTYRATRPYAKEGPGWCYKRRLRCGRRYRAACRWDPHRRPLFLARMKWKVGHTNDWQRRAAGIQGLRRQEDPHLICGWEFPRWYYCEHLTQLEELCDGGERATIDCHFVLKVTTPPTCGSRPKAIHWPDEDDVRVGFRADKSDVRGYFSADKGDVQAGSYADKGDVPLGLFTDKDDVLTKYTPTKTARIKRDGVPVGGATQGMGWARGRPPRDICWAWDGCAAGRCATSKEILRQPNVYNTLASRVLDDAYHFMDRLLRLLSKKHSVFKEFAHQFSETIFVRDQDDEAKVREVLEKKGIPWDYAICGKKAALNRRIRRYIPPPEKLAADLETLFNSFKDEARKTAETLLETVRLGFVSDPPGVALYYVRVEGGVHMLIRRIFGSLRASPELTKATIGNWFLRRNRTIGHYNRTGRKWLSHFDIWLLDDLVKRALTLGIEPSVPVPRLLATTDCHVRVLWDHTHWAAPHHNDVPLHALTRLCTKPCNIYRYIQLRQRAPVPVIPVHTVAEYQFFKQNIDAFRVASARDTAPELAYKTTDYIAFAVFWNRQELLGDANRLAIVLPAIPLEPEQIDFDADAAVGIDLESFNPMAI
ncbi:hypothetical protein B0H14DRAFT_3529089 [Mycena olivaceomarginata]|nr:hypothetical protein B0H14DRAFT_3529089 [Mycena olivaceomarginata]